MLAQTTSQAASEVPAYFYILVAAIGIGTLLFVSHTSGKIAESVGGSYTLWFILTFLLGGLTLAASMILYLVKVGTAVARASKTRSREQLTYPAQAPTGPSPLAYSDAFAGGVPGLPDPRESEWAGGPRNYPAAAGSPQPRRIANAAPIETPAGMPGGMNRCDFCGADNPSRMTSCWRCERPLKGF